MHKFRAAALLLSLLLLFSACNSAANNQTNTTGSQTSIPETTSPENCIPETTSPENSIPDDTGSDATVPEDTGSGTVTQKPMASVSMPLITESTTAADGTVVFKYTHQSMSLILPDPDVANSVIVDFLNRINTTAATADTLREQAKTAYADSFLWEAPYQCQIAYSPMRMDHGILSIYGNSFSYTGGNRPDVSYMAANYDLVTGKVLYLTDIFTNDSWTQSVASLVLESLSGIKDQAQLYDNYENTVKAYFNGNLSKNEGWYFTQTGLCFFFPPYEIAPYSSGTVIAEIPYEKLTGILNAAYFPAERDNATGKISVQKFEEADPDKFSQISELILDSQGKMLLLSTDSYVQDIRITVSNLSEGRMETTVFATYTLTPGDAVMVQLPSSSDKVTLYFTSAGSISTLTLSPN